MDALFGGLESMTGLSRRDFCKTMAAMPSALSAAASGLPNIVYILADDLGWGDLGCYNQETAVPTPRANRFATEGMRFTDMHSPSAVCTPTRYGIMTGRYCWRSILKKGVLLGYSPNLIEAGRMTTPSMLKSRGYYTAGIGKWHLGLGSQEKTDYDKPLRPGPTDHGFDYYFGIPASLDMDPYLYFENDRVVEKADSAHRRQECATRRILAGRRHRSAFPNRGRPADAHQPGNQADRGACGPAGPALLPVSALTAPHTPWVPKPEFQGKSKAGIYGDFVAQVDDTLGQVLGALDKAGLAHNTLVIFTSDNGADWKPEDKERFAHRANANWKGEKADIWDAGHRIPFIARWPGKIPAGAVSDELGCLTDLMGTAAEIAGVKLPKDAGEDSFNLLPALRGKKGRPIREAIVHHSSEGMFSIRQGEWKLELGLGSGGFSQPVRIEPKPGGPKGQLLQYPQRSYRSGQRVDAASEIVARLTALLDKYKADGYTRPM